MPTVSRADCTQVDVADNFVTFVGQEGTVTARYFPVLVFNPCQGEEVDNDLASHYDRMVETLGTATAAERASLGTTLVGEDDCATAISDFLLANI